jgi:hypothetical protein
MKKYILPIISVLVLSILIVNVMAVNQAKLGPVKPDQEQVVYITDNTFSIGSWFSHLIDGQQFSVVGDANAGGIGGQPNKEWNVAAGDRFKLSENDICPMWAVFDVFKSDWTPIMEYDALHDRTIVLSTSANIIVQEYCFPYDFPADNVDCQNAGAGAFSHVSCSSTWAGLGGQSGYSCCLNGVCEKDKSNGIPYHQNYFNYCQCLTQTTLYYVSGSSCLSNTYCCSGSSCPTTVSGNTLYSSKSNCESHITPTCTNPSNWVSSASECCGTKPTGCMDKTCVATASQCGTCKSEDSLCSQDSECCNYLFDTGLKCLTVNSIKKCKYGNAVCDGIGATCSLDSTCCSGKCGGGVLGIGKTCQTPSTTCTSTQELCNGVCVAKGTCNTPSGNAKTITLQEYYSISDDDFMKYANGCKTVSGCSALEGYTVECVTDGSFYSQIQKRIFNSYYTECTTQTPNAVKLLLWLGNFGSLGILPNSDTLCKNIASGRGSVTTWWSNTFGSGSGVCVAKSNSWYGKVWESLLTMVGGFGLPAQYVMIGAVVLLLALLLIGVNLIKK